MKKKEMFGTMVAVLALTLSACSGPGNRTSVDGGENDTTDISAPRYAQGFTVRTTDEGVRLVDVADPQTDEDRMPVSYRFALVGRGSQAQVPEGYTRVEVPIERCIVMTMLQMSNFTALDAHDVISGVTGVKNLFDSDIKARVKRGDIVKIGMEGNFDTELILAANPEVIFISPFKRGGYDVVKETGITLVPHLGYKEL
ncbi:MAG: iron ABC transporter substrate-binding protein, partial [Bacteroidaceae bacterium]|nr:iron ABC transporter substrate-binding protein [Bacteroidaceae bacterium]